MKYIYFLIAACIAIGWIFMAVPRGIMGDIYSVLTWLFISVFIIIGYLADINECLRESRTSDNEAEKSQGKS